MPTIKEAVDGKECSKCGEWKEYGEFYKDSSRKDNRQSWCKKCSQERHQKNKSRSWDEIDVPDEKECSRCGEVKENSEFTRSKYTSDGLVSSCEDCLRQKARSKRKEYKKRDWDEIDVPDHKKCGHCDETKPKSDFTKTKTRLNGLDSWCKECRRRDDNERAQSLAGRDWGNISVPDEAECANCGKVKDKSEFVKEKRRKNGLRPSCKECRNSRRKKRRKERKKRSWDEIDVPETKKCTVCKEKKQSGEFYRNRGSVDGLSSNCISCSRTYKQENRERFTALENKRRAQKLDAMPSWANEEKMKKLYEVGAFLSKYGNQDYHVDHIIPLQHDETSGLHCLNNLQIVPADYNLNKSNSVDGPNGNIPLAEQRFGAWMNKPYRLT